MAGVSVAFACPAATIIEFSLGGNPLMYELVKENIQTKVNYINIPILFCRLRKKIVKKALKQYKMMLH
jgi:hypothetical protein